MKNNLRRHKKKKKEYERIASPFILFYAVIAYILFYATFKINMLMSMSMSRRTMIKKQDMKKHLKKIVRIHNEFLESKKSSTDYEKGYLTAIKNYNCLIDKIITE